MIFKSSEEFFILITGNITTFQGSSVYQKIFLGNFHRITFNLTRINSTEVGGGDGDGSAVKNTDCPSRGSEFNSQQAHGGPKSSIMRPNSLF